ncbi:uncharacterized protein L969DRAFT_15313 [Mixia osmundae IAM 14324]|uniref:Transcription elongation factor Eaf N-terminal domain-containing protein n=1 Tax=Mixia osmundae (strain CBS 9802 / IAM 14324 / JCM 22182 / KY 12970) TaxID=764103 RepID=G7DXA1_MIXOS|nr:uncharacterized protein L969DRAFT_15313 [Mixia osmundae IAM 14324]KEI41295.1 hypothetical protein L969DRAFT_15313 [Mixia osmundae IAM 14324]GAA95211.1 hypothetical protein E5Q_01867 [Mixia osmundae IAM 14324]
MTSPSIPVRIHTSSERTTYLDIQEGPSSARLISQTSRAAVLLDTITDSQLRASKQDIEAEVVLVYDEPTESYIIHVIDNIVVLDEPQPQPKRKAAEPITRSSNERVVKRSKASMAQLEDKPASSASSIPASIVADSEGDTSSDNSSSDDDDDDLDDFALELNNSLSRGSTIGL